jgi:AraC family transcriptional regulator, regulatory protein of adaptative response / methylated-DNA-[protein]-cysteine methyltransferase
MATNTILAEEEAMKRNIEQAPIFPEKKLSPFRAVGIGNNNDNKDHDFRWLAVLDRDRSLDGKFVFAVATTGIFCRPSCPAKRPRPENVQFFDDALSAEQAGYRACLRCRPKAIGGNPQSAKVRAICRYIEQHVIHQETEDRLTLKLLAKEFQLSPFHLQRTFKSILGISPKAYIDACRLRHVKQNLQAGQSVTTSLYAAGYGSTSRLYERTSAQLGMTPEKYRRGAVAAIVHYTIADSPLGRMMIAATDKGICAISFADSDHELQQGLMREFPFASRRRDDGAMSKWQTSLTRLMQGQKINPSLPLDIRATAFQRRVWEALQEIPRGETRSYSALAKQIGSPSAARAVARACASNRIAIAIPCHRIVRENGDLGGYRWGAKRKEQLLALEQGQGQRA